MCGREKAGCSTAEVEGFEFFIGKRGIGFPELKKNGIDERFVRQLAGSVFIKRTVRANVMAERDVDVAMTQNGAHP